MIITRTPFRISLFGGGTDYPAWYRRHGGAVLAATIDKYCYISLRQLPPFFEHRFRIVYSRIETCSQIEEISHPAVRGVLQYLQFPHGLEIHHDGDLPARSGMGSSSAFTVGLLNALYALQGKMVGKRQLALESIHIEQEIIGETVGSQDQVLAAYGGLNYITFDAETEFTLQPLTLRRERLEALNAHLMLFYTGIRRTAANVAQSYVSELENRKRELRITYDLVKEAWEILNGDSDLSALGALMDEGWQIKRSLSARVSNPAVDELYQRARAAGAWGGKLTGAGGGGFMLLCVPPDKREAVSQALNHLLLVPFQFEFMGSQVIFFAPEPDYTGAEQRRAGQNLTPFRELEI